MFQGINLFTLPQNIFCHICLNKTESANQVIERFGLNGHFIENGRG